ncbi:EthD domain-containing protein [Derxia lacustris]|uniref:EthD domain-containing protein n=1 Tax=Derxia lacustris TaxID=764842 RepID=UPI000A17824B|nr:EthD domain-containing protein [Derxia lacustris]
MDTPDPFGLKLMIVGRRRPGSTLAEHRHHIRDVHGERVLRYVATDPDNAPRRYVQNAVFDGSFRASAPGTDAFALNRDFVTEIWVPDFAALGRSRETAFYREHLKGDEDNFVDQATVVFLPVHARVLQPVATAAFKLFGLVRKAPGVDADRFRQAWAQAPAFAPALGHVQNDVLAAPGPPATVDGIDEFWLADEAAARSLAAQWQAWVDDALVRPGLALADASFFLIATEAVLHAGTGFPLSS